MSVRQFIKWTFAISAAFWALLMSAHVAQEVYFRDFPILRRLLQTDHAVIVSFVIVAAASVIATLIVIVFGATAGKLEFEALGLKLKGPSGPVALWCAAFLAIMAGIIATK